MQGIAEAATANWQWSTEGASKPAPKVKGKKDAVHRPGNKKELRRALIEQKRAERTSKAGHFEAQVLFEALHSISSSADGGEWHSPSLGAVGRDTAARIGGHLGFVCSEIGAGERKVVHFLRAAGSSPPSDEEVSRALAAAVAFDETVSGKGVAATLAGQKEIAKKVRDKKAKAAAGQPLTRKLRRLYPEASDSSDESAEDKNASPAGGSAAPPPPQRVVALRQPVAFVQGGIEGPRHHEDGHNDAPPLIKASPYQTLASDDSEDSDAGEAQAEEEEEEEEQEEGEEDESNDSASRKVEEDAQPEGGSPGVQEATDGEHDDDASTPHVGLGAATASMLVPSLPGVSNTQAQDETAGLGAMLAGMTLGASAPVTAEWEGHTRGIGSKVMARMGYRGGQLPGGTGKRVSAHAGDGHTGGGEALAPVGSLPEPIGESVVVRKDKRGIGS